jgi:hypothetical protein
MWSELGVAQLANAGLRRIERRVYTSIRHDCSWFR